jgi:hypothetical protein
MERENAAAGVVKAQVLEATITRADGTVEYLGEISRVQAPSTTGPVERAARAVRDRIFRPLGGAACRRF